MRAVMYHYVRRYDPFRPTFVHLDIESFRRQLDYFQSTDRLIGRSELLGILDGDAIPDDGTILTFDDGLAEHFAVVLPELRRHDAFGIFFIPTSYYMDGKPLDVHRIHHLLGRFGGGPVLDALGHTLRPEDVVEGDRERFDELTYQAQENDDATLIVKRTLNYSIDYGCRAKVIDRLMEHLGENDDDVLRSQYLSRNEILGLHRCGMIIGSHGVSHRVMSRLSIDEQRREISDSLDFLDSITGGLGVRTFCYPYGGFHTFDSRTEGLVKQAGCRIAFNVESRDITEHDVRERPTALPRYDCNMFPHGQATGNVG